MTREYLKQQKILCGRGYHIDNRGNISRKDEFTPDPLGRLCFLSGGVSIQYDSVSSELCELQLDLRSYLQSKKIPFEDNLDQATSTWEGKKKDIEFLLDRFDECDL